MLLAVTLASPLAALLGLLGALVSMATALVLGADPASVAVGLEGYNGLLVTIAVGGIFFAPSRRSLLAGLCGSAMVYPAAQLQSWLLPGLGGLAPTMQSRSSPRRWLACGGRAAPRWLPLGRGVVVGCADGTIIGFVQVSNVHRPA